MASGLDKHRERQATLSSFGKDLARRAKSKCELCESSGVKLIVHEVAPIPPEPEFDTCIMICETCDEQIGDPRKFQSGEHWRCLASTVWGDVAAVQVAAARLLKAQSDSQDWARETLDGLFLEEDIEDWVERDS